MYVITKVKEGREVRKRNESFPRLHPVELRGARSSYSVFLYATRWLFLLIRELSHPRIVSPMWLPWNIAHTIVRFDAIVIFDVSFYRKKKRDSSVLKPPLQISSFPFYPPEWTKSNRDRRRWRKAWASFGYVVRLYLYLSFLVPATALTARSR